MKKIWLSLFCLSTAIFAHSEENFVDSNIYNGGKTAVIFTHFGTTFKDTRGKTIDVINSKGKKAFEGKADVFEAYTSRIVAKRVKEKEGVSKLNPTELLKKLKKEGYENIIIQPSNIIDGVEVDSIKLEAVNFSKDFKNLRVGDALLTSPEQYEKTLKAIMNLNKNLAPNQAIVLVGHGSYDPGTSAYSMLDYMAKDLEYPIYVGTIEGYPTFETMVKQLKKDKKTEVILMPLMLVAGDHANNDIAGDWKKELENSGFKVDVKLTPLGEIPEIQDIIVSNAKFLESHKPIDILSKKAKYSK